MPGTIKNTKDVKTAIETLRHAADMLEAAANGNCSLTDVGKSISLTPQQVNQNLRKQFLPYVKARILEIKDLYPMLDACKTPGDRLMLAILNEDEFDMTPRTDREIVMPPEYNKALLWDIAMDTLTAREYTVISDLYANPNNAADVARKFNVTREHICQIRRKAIHKLRRPHVLKQLFPAMNAWTVSAMEIIEKNARAAVESMDDILNKSDMSEIMLQMARQYMSTRQIDKDTMNAFLRAAHWDDAAHKPVYIKDTDMSARTYNALHRACIDTLDEIAQMHIEDIKKIRNLGELSRDELGVLILKHLGIYRPDLMKPGRIRTESNGEEI